MRKYIVFCMAVCIVLGGSLLLNAEEEKKVVTVELSKCQKSLKNNLATKDIIDSVWKSVLELEKKLGKLPEQAVKDKADTLEWYNKATKLLKTTREKVEKGECNKKLLKDLGWVWQYLVKAGTMGVNVKSRIELELKNQKRKKK